MTNTWWWVGFVVAIVAMLAGAVALAVAAAEEASRYIHDRERSQ